jgi:hypothetical protein
LVVSKLSSIVGAEDTRAAGVAEFSTPVAAAVADAAAAAVNSTNNAPRIIALVGAASAAMGACPRLARCRGIAAEAAPTREVPAKVTHMGEASSVWFRIMLNP